MGIITSLTYLARPCEAAGSTEAMASPPPFFCIFPSLPSPPALYSPILNVRHHYALFLLPITLHIFGTGGGGG
jgi:hypothetical protein